jgi:hypothetical protein
VEYKGIEYRIETAFSVWRWIVIFDANRSHTGFSPSRLLAIENALRTIEKDLRDKTSRIR